MISKVIFKCFVEDYKSFFLPILTRVLLAFGWIYCKMLDFFFCKYAVLLEVVWNRQIIFIIVICSIIFVLSNISLHGICSTAFTGH